MTIALIGPSGAGKGTQAIKLKEKYDLLHISTGDLFRESMGKRTALGLLARRFMNQGALIPDEVVGAVIEEWLWKTMPGKRILFDGFPRNVHQAVQMDKLFQETDRFLETVIYLKVSDDEIIKRLQGRYICRTCQAPYHTEFKPPVIPNTCDICQGELYKRDDDVPDIFRVRLRTSHREMEPLVSYYQTTGKLLIVDGNESINEVFQNIVHTLEAVQQRTAPPTSQWEVEQIYALKETIPAFTSADASHRSLDIILLGGPGSGKGTQAGELSRDLDLLHISTGELFRDNIKNQTELGKLAKNYINHGDLVPDDVTEGMVKERLSRPDAQAGCILDGFPRTIPQAEALTEILTATHRTLDAVLHIKVADEEIVKRLSGRRICHNCQTPYHVEFKPPKEKGVCDVCGEELYQRDDDHPDTILARLKTYHGQTAPLIDYYRKFGLVIEIDGQQELGEVTTQILTALKEITQ